MRGDYIYILYIIAVAIRLNLRFVNMLRISALCCGNFQSLTLK